MRKNSLLWGWLSTGRGCSEVLWSFHLWRSSKAAWAQLWVTCPQEPCLRRQAGLEDLQWSIPRPTIPWLCGSVILHRKGPSSQHVSLQCSSLTHWAQNPSTLTEECWCALVIFKDVAWWQHHVSWWQQRLPTSCYVCHHLKQDTETQIRI